MRPHLLWVVLLFHSDFLLLYSPSPAEASYVFHRPSSLPSFEGSVEIAVLSDTHTDKYLYILDFFTQYVVEHAVRAGDVSAVVFLGDMIDRGRSHRSTDMEYELFLRRHRGSSRAALERLPTFYVPGNHDTTLTTTTPRYQAAFGPSNQAVNVSGFTLFLHYFGDDQCANCTVLPSTDLLLTHYPLYISVLFPNNEWMQVIQRIRPRAVISGHMHSWRQAFLQHATSGTCLHVPELNVGSANYFKAVHGSEGGWFESAGYVRLFKTTTGHIFYKEVKCLPTIFILMTQALSTFLVAGYALPKISRATSATMPKKGSRKKVAGTDEERFAVLIVQ
ncbi:hypothetical protein QOT17_021051 [Balamuthia mandrillaris]